MFFHHHGEHDVFRGFASSRKSDMNGNADDTD